MAFNKDEKTTPVMATGLGRADDRGDDINDAREERKRPGRTLNASHNVRLVSRKARGARTAHLLETVKENMIIPENAGIELHELSIGKTVGIAAYINKIDGDTFVHTLVMETEKSPMRKLKPKRDRNTSSRRHREDAPIYESTSDYFEKDFDEAVEAQVRELIAVQGTLYLSGVTIIPEEVDLKDVNIVTNFIISAEDANRLQSSTDSLFTPDELHVKSTLTAKLDFCRSETISIEGLPLRSDFICQVVEQNDERDGNRLLDNNDGRVHVTLKGYVDAVYIGVEDDNYRSSKWQSATYAPKITATEIDTFTVEGFNYEMMFLALAQLPYLAQNEAWRQTFYPTFGKGSKEDRLRKLGAFGYDIEFNKNDKFVFIKDIVEADIPEYLDKIFVPDRDDRIITSVLVRENTIGFATTKLLIDIANGDDTAFNIAIDALDALTEDNFSKEFQGTRCSDIVVSILRKPSGYYTADGELKPIENIDHLAVLSLLKDNREDITRYIDLVNPTSTRFTPDEREAGLIEMYNELTKQQFIQKGWVNDIELSGEFISALFIACNKCSLKLDSEVDAVNVKERGRRSERRDTHGIGSSLARSRNDRDRSRGRDRSYNTTTRRNRR